MLSTMFTVQRYSERKLYFSIFIRSWLSEFVFFVSLASGLGLLHWYCSLVHWIIHAICVRVCVCACVRVHAYICVIQYGPVLFCLNEFSGSFLLPLFWRNMSYFLLSAIKSTKWQHIVFKATFMSTAISNNLKVWNVTTSKKVPGHKISLYNTEREKSSLTTVERIS